MFRYTDDCAIHWIIREEMYLIPVFCEEFHPSLGMYTATVSNETEDHKYLIFSAYRILLLGTTENIIPVFSRKAYCLVEGSDNPISDPLNNSFNNTQ
jgi:hypothetical protein